MARRAVQPPPPRTCVLGAGNWGTTFAKVLADGGAEVMLWARRPEIAQEIQESKRNSTHLPGVNLPLSIQATSRLDRALLDAEQVYLAVPSQVLRENLLAAAPHVDAGAILVSLVKGVERGTSLRMSEVIADVIHPDPGNIAVISGPNLAREIAAQQPTAAVVSSARRETAETVALTATSSYFHCFISTDVIGTEFGGVLKNLIALAIGIADGVGYGENTQASLITRGLAELTDFSVAYGAEPSTLSGLAGLGDMIATASSPLSRNKTAGRLLGQGYGLADVAKQMRQTTEGLASVDTILAMAKTRGVQMPIVERVHRILSGTLPPADIFTDLATGQGPQKERNIDGQAHGGATFWRSFRRAFGQLRNGGRDSLSD